MEINNTGLAMIGGSSSNMLDTNEVVIANTTTITTSSHTVDYSIFDSGCGVNSGYGVNWIYYPYEPQPLQTLPDINIPNLPNLGCPQEKIIERIIIKEKEEDKRPMKKLFRVYVVTIDEEVILNGKLVVAEDVKDAEFSAEVFTKLKEKGLKPKDVTIICESLGDVKVKEEIQKVQVVNDK